MLRATAVSRYEIVGFPPHSLDPELAALAKWPDLKRRAIAARLVRDLRG
jgi:hypothetical protein